MVDEETSPTSDTAPTTLLPYFHLHSKSGGNGWRQPESIIMNEKPSYSPSSPTMPQRRWNLRSWINFVGAVISAPRFRRYIVVYLALVCMCWGAWVGFASPWLREDRELLDALDRYNRGRHGGWFGANALPKFLDMVHMRSLDPSLLPGANKGDSSGKRLVMVGDVHGCSDELEQLLQKVSFNQERGDHLVFTGNLVTKGPKSAKTVRLAKGYHASCVRGNHDDRVLLTRREIMASTISGSFSIAERSEFGGKEDTSPLPDARDRLLAQNLNDDDAEWLDSCPVILKLGQIGGMGETVVVHAGLVPGVPLEKQDPTTTMTMRTIDIDTHVPSSSPNGVNWAKIFDKHQKRVAALSKTEPSSAPPTTVIYGHDAQRSAAIKTYTKGLDTGCVHGGKLTALIIEDGGKTSTKQVRCRDYTGKKNSWFKFPFL